MTRYAFILSLIATGVILTGFINISLPMGVINVLGDVIDFILSLNGFFDAFAVLYAVLFLLFIQIAIGLFVIFKWIIGA